MMPFSDLINVEKVRTVLIIFFIVVCMCFVFLRSWCGMWETTIRNYFISATFIIIGTVSMVRAGTIDAHSIITTVMILVPSVLVMGALGQWIGYIFDHPKNREDADYELSVLNALRNMDKSMTLEDLNEKLTQTIEEPDLPDEISEEENEV